MKLWALKISLYSPLTAGNSILFICSHDFHTKSSIWNALLLFASCSLFPLNDLMALSHFILLSLTVAFSTNLSKAFPPISISLYFTTFEGPNNIHARIYVFFIYPLEMSTMPVNQQYQQLQNPCFLVLFLKLFSLSRVACETNPEEEIYPFRKSIRE